MAMSEGESRSTKVSMEMDESEAGRRVNEG